MFSGTLLDLMRSRRVRRLKNTADQTKKEKKNSKVSISLLWSASAVSVSEHYVKDTDYAAWPADFWLNYTFNLNPLLVLLFTTGWFWIFKKISTGSLSLLSVVVLSEAALFMCTLFTVIVFPNNDNSYELQNILYLLNLLAVEVVVAITIVIRVVSLRLNLDYSNLVLLTSSVYDAFTQIISLTNGAVLSIWDYFSHLGSPKHKSVGWGNFQLTFTLELGWIKHNTRQALDLLHGAVARRFNFFMGRLGDFYTYWVHQKQQLTYRYVVFNQTAEGVYVDTTILLDLKQPTPKLSNTAAQARGGPYRNSTLTNMLRWDMPEALNVWSQEVYGVSVGDGRGGENYKAKILSYARSLYRQDSVGLEFRNPHETLRVLELLESRIVSQELNSLTTTPNYFGLFSDEVGQYWQKHDSWAEPGLGRISVKDKVHYVGAEAYAKSQRQNILESLLASNFSGRYVGRGWLTDYQVSQLSSDDSLNLNNFSGIRKRLYSANWRPRHNQLSDRGTVAIGRSRHLEQMQDLEGVYARTLRWLEDGRYAREFLGPSFRKMRGKTKLTRESRLGKLAINANRAKKMYRLRGSAWNTQLGSRQRYWEKTKRPRRYLLDAVHKDLWSLNFLDSLGRWKVDKQSLNLADVKRPKARLHIQKGRFPQRKRFSATLTQPTLASNTTPEVGYGLVKKKVRMSGGHMSIHRRLEFYRYWTKIIHKIVKNPTVYGWRSKKNDFITRAARNRTRKRKKHVTWHIDPDHIEMVPYDPKDTLYTQQRLIKPSWYNFVHWAYELKVNRWHVGRIFRLIRDRDLELPIFDRYYRKVDKLLGLHGATHHMYRAENKDIRSFRRNKKLDSKERHDIGTFVEEVIWPERYVQRFVRYRKRRRKKSKIASGLSFYNTRPFMFRLKSLAQKRTKKYLRPKFMRRATPGVHFSKLKPFRWWNRSGVNDEGGLKLRNSLYGLGSYSVDPILITTPQNSTIINWFRWKTWEVLSLYEYLMFKFSPWFIVRGYITNMTNTPKIMFNIVTYLNEVGWGGAFREYGWEFLLRYMLFSKYTVDFFLFYFYVIYESFLQIPGLEEGFLRYSELVYRYSSATQVWDAYVSYWVQAPKIIYELPQSGCTWLTSILYANPVKLTNNLSRGFFMLRTYRVYVLVENSMVFFIRQILLNCTPGILFYPIVDIGFWWKSLGGPDSFGIYRLGGCMEEWLSSWFTSKPGIIRKGGVLKKTIVNRSETFGREGFENLVKYPRKNRRKRVRPKRYRNYTHRAKHSIMWRKVKQSLVNVAMERNGYVGYDSYAESRRYIRKFNKRITRRGLPTATYSAADPYTLIFKENTYSPELISEVSSLFISTLAKQRRQIQLVLPNTGELESRYHMLNQKGSVDFVDFLNHVGKERFETDPVYLETLGDGKELGSFYKEYLRAKIKKHSYSLADLTVRGDVTDMLQKIKVDRGINGLSRPHITNTGGYGPINQLNKIKIHYSPEANLPSGGNLEFFKLVNQRGLPKLIVMGQPQKNLILGVGQNPYGELFSQTPALGFWGNQSSGVGYAYSNAKVSPWSLNSWGIENRIANIGIKQKEVSHAKYLSEIYGVIRKYWYLVKKTSRGPLVYSNSLLENAYSYVNKEWHHSNIDYIQKPPSAEPWGSRGAGPIVTLDRGALPWDEDFDEDAETYDNSSVPLTSREVREEELLREPNAYALFGINDLLTNNDPSTKVRLDNLRYRKLRARYRKEMPIKKTLGRPRPVSFLRIRGRKHRTKELGLTQPRIDTFRYTKNKKNLSFFEKMSSDLGRTVAQKEIFTSTWKQRGGYLLSNLPSISPRSKFKYKSDGLRDFGMSRYLTSYASPYIPYVPYKPSRSDRVGLDSIQVLNNRPSLNEELELDEDRDEESAKISAVMPIYRTQDIKTTDQSWVLVPNRSQITKKLRILTRKKGDVLPPGGGTFPKTGASFFANLPTNQQRAFRLRTFARGSSPSSYNTKSRFSTKGGLSKLDARTILGKVPTKISTVREPTEKFKGSYMDQTRTKVFIETKSGVGLDADVYLTHKMGGLEGKKSLLNRALGRKLFSTLATTNIHNYGTTDAEPDLVKIRKKQRRTIRRRLRVRYASLWRPKKLRTRRDEPYANQKRLRAEQHIHFPYRKKKFWSQNESEYVENKIVGVVDDLEKRTLDRLGGHFLKTFFLGRKQQPKMRNKLKDYYGVRFGRASKHPVTGPDLEEPASPRSRRRRKTKRAAKRRRFPRRFFSSRDLIKRDSQTASEVYYRSRRPRPFAPLKVQTWYLDKRPNRRLRKWAKKFGYRKNIRRVYSNAFFAGITFYKRRTKMHSGINNKMRDFRKNVLYANSLVVPLGSKKSGNSFRESLDILRASSYARRAEREYGNSESLSEPFIRYFRSASALEESLFFKSKKQEYRKNKKINELASSGKLNDGEISNLLFSSKDPYLKNWLKPMSQSRSLDDLVPSTLTSSRNLASLRNFAIYEDSDFNWSTFQDVDIIEEDPDWPRFGQFYKRMRHRNTAYALNESGFFTHQDWGLENKTKYGNVMGRTPLLRLISNYTYEEYGLPDKKAEKRLRASQRPTSILNRDSIGDISTGIGYVPRPTTVTHSDYLDTLGGVRLGYTQSKDSLTPYIDRKSTTFTESQTLCLSQGSDSASKLWAKKLAEQSLSAVLGVCPVGVGGYRSVIEQTIRGDFSELVVPQEELLVKFGSAVLGKALVPIFMHVTEEKNWLSWLFGDIPPVKLAVVWVRLEDVGRVFEDLGVGFGTPSAQTNLIEKWVREVGEPSLITVKSHRGVRDQFGFQTNKKVASFKQSVVGGGGIGFFQLKILEFVSSYVGAFLKDLWFIGKVAPTLFHLGVSAYQEVMWLIFPRTRPQSQDKTPMLGWVQQAYWECLLIKIPPIIIRSARYLAEIVAIWGHLGFTKNVQIILNSPKIIFKLIFNFSADIWRMFYAPEEVGWDIARGLLRYIAVGDASEGVHLFGWTYFVAVPYRTSFILLRPLRIKWEF